MKKKETYTISTSYVTSRHGTIAAMREMAIAEESEQSSSGSSDESQDDVAAVVIENSFTTATTTKRSGEVQIHVDHVLTTLTPPKDTTNGNAVLIENTHIAATPEPESTEDLSAGASQPEDDHSAGTNRPVDTQEVTSTTCSDEAMPHPLTDQNSISKTDLADKSLISDPIDLTIVNVSFEGDHSSMDSLDQQDSCHHTSADLNGNLNNNVLTNVSVRIENPYFGTAELLQDAYTNESNDLNRREVQAGIKQPAVSERETTSEDGNGSKEFPEETTDAGSDSRAVFV